jgi:hypothetical protein
MKTIKHIRNFKRSNRRRKSKKIYGGEITRDIIRRINEEYPPGSAVPPFRVFSDFLTTNSDTPIPYADRVRYQNYLLDRLGMSNLWGIRNRNDSITSQDIARLP